MLYIDVTVYISPFLVGHAMISDVLRFLKDSLNAFLMAGRLPDDTPEDVVVFLDGANMEPLSFKLGAVTVLLINIEEETTLRSADTYSRVSPDGVKQKINPEIRLNLYVLFVARFREYEEALRYLSRIIRYFQQHRLITPQTAPSLSEKFEKLVIELITLPFSEQNEVWNALRVTYHPSVLYKVKMVVFEDEDSQIPAEVGEQQLRAAYEISTIFGTVHPTSLLSGSTLS